MGSIVQDDERPAWARRMRAERTARSWSQPEAVRVLRAHGDSSLPAEASLLRNWKRWEAGEVEPDDFYKKLIAKTFGTATAAFFPTPSRRDLDVELLSGAGMDTLEVLARMRASDVSASTLEALRITADKLCCEYPYMPSAQLRVEGTAWLRRITQLLGGKTTLAQHRELLSLAGLVALLVGCVEYDMGDRPKAEGTRRAAFSLGEEADDLNVVGWAQEMRAWYSLTQGDYRGAVVAAQRGEQLAGSRSVSVQLAAQQAKAWARMGDRRQVEVALDRGRAALEALPPPEDTSHHFVVDPAKFDFYAMDCYRVAGENPLASLYAHEVIRTATDFDGQLRAPMRAAEARITLGVIAARSGDLEQAINQGSSALKSERLSLPSLLMCTTELTTVLQDMYPNEPSARGYLEEVRAVTAR
jgi:tetratricopeptide (TPR) repeat protein